MPKVVVRNLDDQMVTALRHKAELHGHSLEQELRLTLVPMRALPEDGSSLQSIPARQRHSSQADKCLAPELI